MDLPIEFKERMKKMLGEEYDEFELLMAGKGRCAQDNYYLEEITEETFNNLIDLAFFWRVK